MSSQSTKVKVNIRYQLAVTQRKMDTKISNNFINRVETCREQQDYTNLTHPEKQKALQLICKAYLAGADDWKSSLADISNLFGETQDSSKQRIAIEHVAMTMVFNAPQREHLQEELDKMLKQLADDPAADLEYSAETSKFLDWHMPKHHPDEC